MKISSGARIAGAVAAAIATAAIGGIFCGAAGAGVTHGQKPIPLIKKLKSEHMKIAWERYPNDNWEIFVMRADGTHPVNLTHSQKLNEHYPQISPDGKRIAYSVDVGEGQAAVRSLWIMNIDGTSRYKIADHAREPFWSPDGKTIGYLPQEFPNKFNVMDYYTRGMAFYHLDTHKTTPFIHSSVVWHLYNAGFSPNGKWVVATVHAGMALGHAILLIEMHGNRILNLQIPGCRPRISPDGKQIAWGATDNELCIAPLDTNAPTPKVGPVRLHIVDRKNKIYHINWSPDCRYVAFSRGPDGEGDLTKRGSFQAACEIVGVYAKGWNICVVSAERSGMIDLQQAGPADFAQLTADGASNKQPAWFKPGRLARHR
jgi:hypothetical protein